MAAFGPYWRSFTVPLHIARSAHLIVKFFSLSHPSLWKNHWGVRGWIMGGSRLSQSGLYISVGGWLSMLYCWLLIVGCYQESPVILWIISHGEIPSRKLFIHSLSWEWETRWIMMRYNEAQSCFLPECCVCFQSLRYTNLN